ncbi:hypothetical protein BCS42_14600 [Crenothrix sp. D3]|nr:hypothetical protein BCS42_14600 [Crenothrix sp. D3]
MKTNTPIFAYAQIGLFQSQEGEFKQTSSKSHKILGNALHHQLELGCFLTTCNLSYIRLGFMLILGIAKVLC